MAAVLLMGYISIECAQTLGHFLYDGPQLTQPVCRAAVSPHRCRAAPC